MNGWTGFDELLNDIGRPAEHAGLPAAATPDIPALIEAVRHHGGEILGPPLTLHEVAMYRVHAYTVSA